MSETSEEQSSPFNADEVQKIGKETIESIVGGNTYQHNKVNQWSNSVCDQLIAQLTKQSKSFKYVVTCVIVQKNGAGLHTSASCLWDTSTDGSCFVRWENKSMHCIVQVFALAI